ncbi:MAG: ABC transporter ATP-binding protein/permease, partial [Rickettsiales bacterium]|nr:ABC transporter ATP-binding protein/permease [Rickettsiales bacterium]
MFEILKYLGKYKKYVILTIFLVLLVSIIQTLIPYITGIAIDIGVKNGMKSVSFYASLQIIITILGFALDYAVSEISSYSANGFGKNLQTALFDKIQEFSSKNIDKFSNSSLLVRLTTDIVEIKQTFCSIIRIGIFSPFMIISSLVLVFITSPKLSSIFAFVIPVLVLSLLYLTKTALIRFKGLLKQLENMNLSVKESLTNVKLVKSSVGEKYEYGKFESVVNKYKNVELKLERLVKLNRPIIDTTIVICMVSVIYFGGKMVTRNEIHVGQLLSFTSYIYMISSSLMFLSFMFASLLISRASIDRVLEVLREESDIKSPQSTKTFDNYSIEFRNVNFSYNNGENLVLKDINFKINEFETIGIIGGATSGKSTLISLIARLFDVENGEILVGGHNVKDYDLKYLRTQIALVPQKNVLFSGTIKQNLLYAYGDATDSDIVKVCRQAQAEEFISCLPNQYDYKLE